MLPVIGSAVKVDGVGISSLLSSLLGKHSLWSEAMLCETVNNIFSNLTDDSAGQRPGSRKKIKSRIKICFTRSNYKAFPQEGTHAINLPPETGTPPCVCFHISIPWCLSLKNEGGHVLVKLNDST